MKYAELSSKAKGRARNWYRAVDEFNAESVIDDAVTCLAFLGFDIDVADRPFHAQIAGDRQVPKIYWRGFYTQGRGASFTARWRAQRVDMAALKQHAPQDKTLERICAGLSVIALRYPDVYADIGVSGRGNLKHSMVCELDDEFNERGVTGLDKEILALAREAADWIYKQLENEYDYMNSDENVEEVIKANEYEFDEDGHIC